MISLALEVITRTRCRCNICSNATLARVLRRWLAVTLNHVPQAREGYSHAVCRRLGSLTAATDTYLYCAVCAQLAVSLGVWAAASDL